MKNDGRYGCCVWSHVVAAVLTVAVCLASPAAVLSCASADASSVREEEPSGALEEARASSETDPGIPSGRADEAGFDRYAFAVRLAGLLEAGDFEAALSAFDEVPEPDASSLDIQKLKLSVLVSTGDMKAASALADSLEAEHKNDAEILYAQATIALAENKTQRRSAYLKKIVSLEPENTDALLALATDSLGKKAYGDARTWFQKAVDGDPGNIDAWKGLAHACYMQDKLDDARSAIDEGLAAHPGSAALWAESALIHNEAKDLPAALEDIRRAISLDSSVASYWTNYGVMLVKASKLADAREAFNKAIELNPDDYFPYIYRCGINDTLGYTQEALADYRFVCERFPQYYYAAEGLGVLLWLQGDYSGAKNAFALANAYAPKNASYALMYTLCCYKLSQNDEARKFIGKYMNTLDRGATEYFVCRLFYDKTGDSDVVGRISREKDASDRAKYMFYIASYYELFQNPTLAEKMYAEITSLQSPTFFEYRLAAAKCVDPAGTISGLPGGGGG